MTISYPQTRPRELDVFDFAAHPFDHVVCLGAADPQGVRSRSPVECPKCKGPMRVIALIDDPGVVRRILEHLGRWGPEPAERGPPVEALDWPRTAVIPISYHPLPDIA